jgi:hypothetical protein
LEKKTFVVVNDLVGFGEASNADSGEEEGNNVDVGTLREVNGLVGEEDGRCHSRGRTGYSFSQFHQDGDQRD